MVERVGEVHPDPSALAFGFTAPRQRLYTVKFRQIDVRVQTTGCVEIHYNLYVMSTDFPDTVMSAQYIC